LVLESSDEMGRLKVSTEKLAGFGGGTPWCLVVVSFPCAKEPLGPEHGQGIKKKLFLRAWPTRAFYKIQSLKEEIVDIYYNQNSNYLLLLHRQQNLFSHSG
jgi:hypothetical protein